MQNIPSVWWCYDAYFLYRSTAHLGPMLSSAVTPLSPPNQRTLPVDADDFYVYFDRIDEQSENSPSLISGPNLITKFYAVVSSVDTEAKSLDEALSSLTAVLDSGIPALTSAFEPEISLDVFMDPKDRRQLQMELLKASIRIAWLSCRASLLQAYQASSSFWASLAADAALFLKKLPNTYVEPQGAIVVPHLKTLSEMMMHVLTTAADSRGSASEEDVQPKATEDVAYVAMRVAELERETMISTTGANVNANIAQEDLAMTEASAPQVLP
jgi:hypothetical protein